VKTYLPPDDDLTRARVIKKGHRKRLQKKVKEKSTKVSENKKTRKNKTTVEKLELNSQVE